MTYQIYGLIIDSEIVFEELYEVRGEKHQDVKIINGEMPEFILQKKEEGYINSIAGIEYSWFFIEGLGDFYIHQGNKIIIHILEGADSYLVRAMILGAALGDIMLQREMIAIHGGAVVYNNEAWLICGDSGAGKSSLLFELMKLEDAQFLADDTLSLSKIDKVYVNPAYPQQKLCKDAAIRNGFDIDGLVMLDEDREKYAVDRKDSFYKSKAPVKFICILEVGTEFELKELNGHEKLKHFMNNLYPAFSYQRIGIFSNHFKKCLEIVADTKIFLLTRPEGIDTVVEQVTLIRKSCVVF